MSLRCSRTHRIRLSALSGNQKAGCAAAGVGGDQYCLR
ncbi:hypothetical protein I553_5854 [Mycobacterium xenopi 4042]|uniref:Uncharacterized protein n=1 Tax=Mycobacterium xenopi 4042 TaxID=1299334 RepID=X7ZYU3_MYCXE|nr:hypothetical protein I553_5854 [Mycobacterium xenopi 4042]